MCGGMILSLIKWWLQDFVAWLTPVLAGLLILAGLVGLAVAFPVILFIYAIGIGFWIIDHS